ncbi:MAG: tryptophan synthase subunit alpha [Chloroflexota bacterium]|nr:tryptophan synthase subunit alpha [Chloroflexota bacterium]
MNGPRRIREAFEAAAARGRTALIAYILAGYPTGADGLAAAEAALDGGADLLEVGVPFSDPLADGPTIADAGRVALAAGGGLPSAQRLVASLRERGHATPIMVMSYLNPLLAAGEHETLHALHAAGADGIIVPDLPSGASPRIERLAASLGLATSFLVAPNTSAARIEIALKASTGFLYVVPLFGVTGARDAVASGAGALIASVRARAAGRAPVAAGFGLSTPEQVAALAPAADGLIIGSALVAAMRDGGSPAVGSLVQRLTEATALSARDVRA